MDIHKNWNFTTPTVCKQLIIPTYKHKFVKTYFAGISYQTNHAQQIKSQIIVTIKQRLSQTQRTAVITK